MAETATIARPYAEAAFSLAHQQKALPDWSEALERLAQLAGDAQTDALIGNPNVASGQIEDLFRAVGGKNAEVGNFVHLLTRNGRLACLPEIAAQFHAMKQDEEGVREGVVHSAFPLNENQLRDLKTLLEGRFGRLQLSVKVDPALIGGVKVVVGDQVLDTSVSGKLAAMRAALNS
ncbi:MAG: F0F1 ATP synthase subunit delta [Zoogloeaceae bacterium]|jgi:F-type H+-transporting ATPase subunit delta|nr:F0F1 ATP synthase subunit delta [Zoogloeaceae bacterium]